MLLSDQDIKAKLEAGDIKIDPLPNLDICLGTVSLDLHLDNEFLVYRNTSRPFIDVNDPESFQNLTEMVVKADTEAFVIHPGQFVLGSTMETIGLPDDLAGRLEGKSSLGRLGIVIHSTAGKIDPGFDGRITLEISNIGTMPIMLYPNMRICQLLFEALSSPTTTSYVRRKDSKYKVQNSPLGSRISSEKGNSI